MFSCRHVVFAPSDKHLCCDDMVACQIVSMFVTVDHNLNRKYICVSVAYIHYGL